MKDKNKAITSLRRADRAMDDDWIRTFLTKAHFCNVATVADGRPFITMNTFVYDQSEHAIYMHTAKNGRLAKNVAQSSDVCLSAGEMGRLLPAKVAREFSVEYASVVVFGRISIVADPKVARDCMQMLNEKYFPHLKPGEDYRPVTPEEIKEINCYRVDIDAWSGKQKKADTDFPGAFYFKP